MVRMRAPNVFDTAVQTNETSPIKHENKRNVLSCMIECLMAKKESRRRTRKDTSKRLDLDLKYGKTKTKYHFLVIKKENRPMCQFKTTLKVAI